MDREPWVSLHIPVPQSWRDWLHEAAIARGTTMTGIVRGLIRSLMIQRHGADE